MKPIKIAPENYPKITAALAAANGRAREHTYNTGEEVAKIAQEAEDRLHWLELPKAERPGARYYATSGVAKAYKPIRLCTSLQIERRATGWFFIAAVCVYVRENPPAKRLVLAPAQKARAVQIFAGSLQTS